MLGSVLVMGAGSLLGEDTCYETRGDPESSLCLVEAKPIDLLVDNWHDDPHTVSVRISDSSGVVYSETVRLDSREQRTLEDVIQSPGEYHVQATLETGERESTTMTVERRHCLECPKLVRVTTDGDLRVVTRKRG